MDRNVRWVVEQYPTLANHPMFLSRQQEFRHLKAVAEHYGIDLSMQVFDEGIAERFGHGCEYEWSRD